MKKNRRSGSKNSSAAPVQNVKTNLEAAVPETAPEAETTEEIILQFGENEVTVDAVLEKAKQDYKDSGSEAELKDIKIYVKPEDNKAYYVVNGETEGNVDLV